MTSGKPFQAERPATLVLSGGGAKGAFQVGAERVLREQFGFRWQRIFGVSVGALNGALLGQEQYQNLLSVWRNIREADVYRKFAWTRVAWRLVVEGKRGLYDNRPLRDTIRKHTVNKPFTIPVHVGRVSLTSGQYETVPHTAPDFLDAVWHSATLPVVWESIGKEAYVDGGLRNVTPLGDALEFDPQEIVVMICNRDEIDPAPSPRNILDVAKRSLADITINEIMINDVREFLRINRLVAQARKAGVELTHESGRPYRECNITVVQPSGSLGDSLDFSTAAIEARLRAGDEAARKALATVFA
ncbi:MAG: patatin-like phospholipase family protein [Longimicrobiales bacterium]